MARRILTGKLLWPAVVSALVALAGSGSIGAQQARGRGEMRPVPCSEPPDKFAVEFFKVLESGPVSPHTYEDAFAFEFKRATPLNQLQSFVKQTHARFGIDQYDRPLDTRLAGPPYVERLPGKPPSPDQLTVTLLAFTSQGQARQRVELLCENQLWKVMRFSYEPAKY
jgi:hypothetical protein